MVPLPQCLSGSARGTERRGPAPLHRLRVQPPCDSRAQPGSGEGKAASAGEAVLLWPCRVLCYHSAKQEGVGGIILLFGLFLRCGIDSMWQITEHFLPKDIVLHFETLL